MEVLIVGAGSMGRWFARSVDAAVAFADVDEAAAGAAAEAVDGTVAALEGERTFDAVCLAVPMAHVTAAVADHADRADAALVDVAGAMGPPLSAMRTHAPDRERVSLHPLFAPERAPGSIAVVRDASGPVSEALLEALEARGNDLVATTATEHDEAMESVQAAAHAAVFSFALAAESVPEGFETPVYERLRSLAELVTDGTPRVYADIQRTFDGADAVADAAARIADADDEELEAIYREAAERWHSPGGTTDGSDDADGSNDVDGNNDADAGDDARNEGENE